MLSSYLTDRKIQVKFNGEESEFLRLVGGGPQRTLIGQLEYLVYSNDRADAVPQEDRYKYVDDLTVLRLVLLSGILTEYDFKTHVASDVAIHGNFLPIQNVQSQNNLDKISQCT